MYVPFRVEPDALASAIDGLWALNVQGFNVTVPHKEAVMELVQADECSRLIGAANTVIRTDSGWQATNTDWIGFARALEAVAAGVAGATVLMFGAGGTAKAVIHALAEGGVERLFICNRGRERAERLATHTREHYPHIHCELVEWGGNDVEAVCLESKIVINTTSIGLKTDDQFPFALPGEGVAVDVVYRPDGKTPFCRVAGESGRLSIDGLPMLIAQGAESFSKWFKSASLSIAEVFRWTEAELSRQPVKLPGWERV